MLCYVIASPVGLAAILSQAGSTKTRKRHIITYASRSLTATEQYSQVEREALTEVWACEHLYLSEKESDHLYNTWRDLFIEIRGVKNSGICPCQSACSLLLCRNRLLRLSCQWVSTIPNNDATNVSQTESAEFRVLHSPPSSIPSPYSISTLSGTVQIEEDL